MIKILLSLLIFASQSVGIILIGVGLDMIWEPLGWIYSGAMAFLYGRWVYQAMEPEGNK